MRNIHAHKLALIVCTAIVGAGRVMPARAQADGEAWNANFQATYVWQGKEAFPAAYSGANSLSPAHEKSYSFTATAFFGLRLWDGGELYLNPEAAQGMALSGLTGLGGFSNGEIARTSGASLTLYHARAFLRQSWDVGGERESVESGPNQLAGSVAKRRWVLTLGELSVTDLFDNNLYNHDPRTQFLNWSLMTYGAYDYAADARGYSRGAALEWYHDEWAVRAGRFLQPSQPNVLPLDPHWFRHYGDQVEFEHAHELNGLPGKLRVLVFRNRTRMARYQDAIDLGLATGTTPDINLVRNTEQIKSGIGVNLEQALSDDIGLFARASRADGNTETYAFAEIDDSLSGGLLIKGNRWSRADDTIGIAAVRNGLSRERRDYLAAGGISFFIGDGHLNYKPEAIVETYYSFAVTHDTRLSLDWQRIANPAYNADRGPVNLIAARLHVEF
ncbi:MAG TPA: carbohydrate porin [Candidatus Acidoferrum sp.]|nr:carbohydrate porin [Candidatus Acidoferrum sp.]